MARNADNPPIQEKYPARRLYGAPQIMRSELWIPYVSSIGREHTAGDLANGIGKKRRIIDGLRREV
jgi:hypothetical protein